jgi:hypothetical protein
MKNVSDDVLVICSLVKEGPASLPYAVKGKCFNCEDEIWLAQSSISLLESVGDAGKPCCLPCGDTILQGKKHDISISKDQIAELANETGLPAEMIPVLFEKFTGIKVKKIN